MPATEESEDLITVGKPEDDQKAVWDQHPNHPANYEQAAGEVFIPDMRPYSVFRSPGIQQKLGERPPALRELNESQQSARTKAYEEQQAETAKQQQSAQELTQTADRGTAVHTPASRTAIQVSDEEREEAEGQDKPGTGVARPARRP